MIRLTKKIVEAFDELSTNADKFPGYYFYYGKPMSRWLLLQFRFAVWRMKTFRLFKKPLYLQDDTAKSP